MGDVCVVCNVWCVMCSVPLWETSVWCVICGVWCVVCGVLWCMVYDELFVSGMVYDELCMVRVVCCVL